MEFCERKGLHPMIDYWARKAQGMRGGLASASPVSWPCSETGGPLKEHETKRALGRILVALCRDPFEHPFGPSYDHQSVVNYAYTLLEVEKLINAIFPLYGLTLEELFIYLDIWKELEVGKKERPPYTYWTDPDPNPIGRHYILSLYTNFAVISLVSAFVM